LAANACLETSGTDTMSKSPSQLADAPDGVSAKEQRVDASPISSSLLVSTKSAQRGLCIMVDGKNVDLLQVQIASYFAQLISVPIRSDDIGGQVLCKASPFAVQTNLLPRPSRMRSRWRGRQPEKAATNHA